MSLGDTLFLRNKAFTRKRLAPLQSYRPHQAYEFRSELHSVCAFFTAVFMEHRRRTSLKSLLRTSDVDTQLRLRSADSAMLVVPSTRRSTLGDRAFPVASARNSLPSSVRNAPSLTTFRRELKTILFRSSFDTD